MYAKSECGEVRGYPRSDKGITQRADLPLGATVMGLHGRGTLKIRLFLPDRLSVEQQLRSYLP
jgi:hypothetical protein